MYNVLIYTDGQTFVKFGKKNWRNSMPLIQKFGLSGKEGANIPVTHMTTVRLCSIFLLHPK